MTESSPRPVVAFAPDLLDRSRIAAALPQARFVADARELAEASADALALIDLSRPGALDALPLITASTVGFASHVDDALLGAARAAGCGEVLPRSRFFRRLAQEFGQQ